MWLPVENVRDMASSMKTPAAPVEITGVPENRALLPCPDCTDPMEALFVFGISLDVCTKRHGMWFDANELGTMLFRIAKTDS
ncbi:MAG: zf-TFIIB domain-containing protein [Kofleriaceae bacterium]